MDALDRLDRLELKAELLREIDGVRADLKGKADNKDLSLIATEMSRMQLDQAERNRALRDGLNELEKAVKSFAALIPVDGATRNRWSLREIDPRVLLVAGIAGGAAVGKGLEYLLSIQ